MCGVYVCFAKIVSHTCFIHWRSDLAVSLLADWIETSSGLWILQDTWIISSGVCLTTNTYCSFPVDDHTLPSEQDSPKSSYPAPTVNRHHAVGIN